MGLAINGDVVHGLAIRGQAFQPLSKGNDGSYNIDGEKYYPYDSDNDSFVIGNKSYNVYKYFYLTSDKIVNIQSGINTNMVTLYQGNQYLIVNDDGENITVYLPPNASGLPYGDIEIFSRNDSSGKIIKTKYYN